MYATQNRLTSEAPPVDIGSVTARYLLYPETKDERMAEGGMRTRGLFKHKGGDSPLVSVITTVFNRHLFLEKAICSVLMQTYPHIEYIVIDAASDDGTIDVIEKYDDVIDYYLSESDGGIYDGMNKGLALAQGDCILFLNSDDWYMPECVEVLVEALQMGDHDMVCALAVETDQIGNVIRRIPKMPFGDNVRMRMPLRHETMLVRSELYNRIGAYDSSYQIIADLKMAQMIYKQTRDVVQLDRYLMYFRKMGVAHQLTDTFLRERERLLSEQFGFLSTSEVTFLARDFNGRAEDYLVLADRYGQHDDFVNAIRGFLKLHGM